MCHCGECQRRTGSVFGVGAYYDKARIRRIEGTGTTYLRGSDSGSTMTFSFCPGCGTTLYWESDRRPHRIGVAVGGFGDPSFPAPQSAVWLDAQQHRKGTPPPPAT
jgi:hypothetical protein